VEGIFVRDDYVGGFLQGFFVLGGTCSRELPGKTIVDLKEDLHFWQVVVYVVPYLVDGDCNSRLWLPRQCFWQQVINAVEVVPAVSISVLHVAAGMELSFGSAVPLFNAGVRRQPALDEGLGFLYR
jgi:hypothetical protein